MGILTRSNYKDCVLKAVNLGRASDTIGCIAGGLAGLYYRYESIPQDWLDKLKNKEVIYKLCDESNFSL